MSVCAPEVRPRRRRRLLVAAAIVAFVAFVLAGIAWYLDSSERRDFAAALADTDRLDPGWRLDEIAAARTAIPDDRNAALHGAQVLYVKEWGATACYGDTAADARLRSQLTGWCVRNDWFGAAPECHVMHCLPVRRNTAIADEVLDSARSVVQREAYNRLPAQMAVLHQLLSS